MAVAPTRVQSVTIPYVQHSGIVTTTSSAFAVQAGDLLTVRSMTHDSGAAILLTDSVGLTWNQRQVDATASHGWVSEWTAIVPSSQASFTYTLSVSPNTLTNATWGGRCTTWRNHGGVGVSNKSTTGGANPSVVLAGCSANSAFDCLCDDWNAGSTTSTWGGTVAATLETNTNVATQATFYEGFIADGGAAGSKTINLSTIINGITTIAAVEILAATSSVPPYTGDDFPDFKELGPSADFSPNGFIEDAYPPAIAAGSGNVTFSMGTTQAILNLNGIVYTKLLATVKPPQASLTLNGIVYTKLIGTIKPPQASMTLSGITYTKLLATVKPPQASMTLSGLIGKRMINAPGVASMTFAGIVAKPQAVTKPPVAVVTFSGITYTKLTARFTVSAQAIFTFAANVPGLASVPVTFNMGTTQAILNLSGITYTKLLATVKPPVSTLTLSGLAPKEIERVFPPFSSIQVRATVPSLRLVQSVPIAALTLSASATSHNIVTVTAPVAVLRFTGIGPTDPTSSTIKPQKIRALGSANLAGGKDNISR